MFMYMYMYIHCVYMCSGVRRYFGVGGLKIGNLVDKVGYASQNLGGSRGMLPQEILDFHIFLEQLWCILSTLFDKYRRLVCIILLG